MRQPPSTNVALHDIEIMEAEERPAKLQKRTHDDGEQDAEFLPDPNVAPGSTNGNEIESRGQNSSTDEARMYDTKKSAGEQEPDATIKDCKNPAAGRTPGGSKPALPEIEVPTVDENGNPLSKNQQKKLRRKLEWEAGREDRKAFKKVKRKAKQERKREAKEAELLNPELNNPSTYAAAAAVEAKPRKQPMQLPVTFIFDCDFDQYMTEKEIISITAQITRSYSDNKKAPYRAHMAISGFGGRMKERLETVLAGVHQSWKGVRFFEEDFVHVAEKAKEWMKSPDGGKIAGALGRTTVDEQGGEAVEGDDKAPDDEHPAAAEPHESKEGEVIYLTADSDNEITHLTPYSTYIFGGIVDKNRHKGICYKRAMDRSIKTGRLPIGKYLKMNSRQVLTTNHVNDIMLKWFELGDWGEAFMQVLPARKGGVLRDKPVENGEAEGKQNHTEGDYSDGTSE